MNIPVWRKILYAALVFLLFFGTLELVLRYVVKSPETAQSFVGERQFVNFLDSLATGERGAQRLYVTDRELLWKLRPSTAFEGYNFHRAVGKAPVPIRVTINEYGYRGAPYRPKAAPGALRILCLGDSNFFGYPLDDREVFPVRLEEELARRLPGRDVQVVNGGVPGYSSRQGKLFFQKTFAARDFDLVLISFLNNDAWPQPLSDREVMEKRRSVFYPLTRLLSRLEIYRFVARKLFLATGEEMRPRVPPERFVGNYEEMTGFFLKQGTPVIVTDFRAFKGYSRYSDLLRDFAVRHDGVAYFNVAAGLAEDFDAAAKRDRYPDLAARVVARWGTVALTDRPHLWAYAEFAPQHLNELGAVWLARRMSDAIIGSR